MRRGAVCLGYSENHSGFVGSLNIAMRITTRRPGRPQLQVGPTDDAKSREMPDAKCCEISTSYSTRYESNEDPHFPKQGKHVEKQPG